jgi:hypothetical protein
MRIVRFLYDIKTGKTRQGRRQGGRERETESDREIWGEGESNTAVRENNMG